MAEQKPYLGGKSIAERIRDGQLRVILPSFTCNRCGHEWIPRAPREPDVCPKCKSPYWNKPRVR